MKKRTSGTFKERIRGEEWYMDGKCFSPVPLR